jgi:outer membrane protein assembly factor BamD (BamD/ComL family)
VQRATPRARAPVVFQVDPQPTTSDGLAEEAQALTEVHAALSRKDADLAWKLLQEQNHRFPSGQLGEERAAAKVMALCSAGRYDEADHAQAEFALTYPNSPLAKRVKRGCAP